MGLYRIIVVMLTLLNAVLLYADDNPRGKLHGYAFGDIYYKMVGDDARASPSQYATMAQGMNGVQFRRLNLYYDINISEDFFTRIIIEGNDETLTGENTTVFIREAYLQWRNIIPRHDILVGILPTPTWSIGYPERIWSYRSVEKTITEFRELGVPTDFGVAVHGSIDSGGTVQYVGMIGSGRTLLFNDNAYKNYYFMLQVEPWPGIMMEGYVDRWMGGDGFHTSTYKLFAAYRNDKLTIGSEILYQVQEHASLFERHREVLGLSLFIHGPVLENIRAFGRYDFYDPDRNVVGSGYRESFFVLGLDYRPFPDIQVMPNIWLNTFSPKSRAVEGKDTDIVFRISLLYSFQ